MRSVLFSRIFVASIVLSYVGCAMSETEEPDPSESLGTSTQALCVYPSTATFGAADMFNLMLPDPNPYPLALPEFVTFLNGLGVPTAIMKTFDDQTSDRHMVASLRHGLRGCFGGATSLNLCFRARALPGGSSNDSVAIYNTDFGTYLFPVVFSSAIAPTLIAAWPTGTNATLCINLTSQMTGGMIGDMLQFRVQDDTAVDVITMTLN